MSQIDQFQTRLKNGDDVIIRTARESDAAAYLGFREDCLLDGEGVVTLPGERQRTVDQQRQLLGVMLQSATDLVLLAILGEEIIGNIAFTSEKRERLKHTGDFGMAVRRPWRSQGLGSVLLGALIDWAEANPLIEKINLRVLASNARAIGLYKKFGFVEEGHFHREIKYEDGRYDDELLMARLL